MTDPFRTTRRVEFRDTDAAGIIHFSAFFHYMEEVEHEFLRSLGLSVLARDEHGVVSWPRVAASCNFRTAVRFEDVLDVELRLARIGEKSVTYAFRFAHQGREVADGEITAVCCRMPRDGPPRSMPIPPEVRARLGNWD
ncbi:MAG TPA: thioesterase family protein [Pirellulales bacterium]|nr:thioesterase family protein [Pirellulales bacterium]